MNVHSRATLRFRKASSPYLDVAQGASEHAQIGRLLLVHVGDVPLQGLEAFLQVRASKADT